MTGEFDLCGVFVPPLLLFGLLAMVLNVALRAVLLRAGFFRAVWHAPLAELALYIMIFCGVTLLLPEWME
jgi:hypothetical protein